MSDTNGKSGNGTASEPRGFQFPGDFEITAMGDAAADLPKRVPQVLHEAGFEVRHETVSHRPSREGNYLAVRVTVHCETRERYEEAHRLLRAMSTIHVTL